MKKHLIKILFVVATGTVLILNGCSKDDTTPPVITLDGDASIELSLNSGAWNDPGATAVDDEDGDLSASITSDASSTNPNVNLVGYYTVTYRVTDKAGNEGTETRSIYVKNDADDYAGTYDVFDTVLGTLYFHYEQDITVDLSVNNRVHFSLFGNYDGNTAIYANKLGNGNLEMPVQNALNIGANHGGSCDVVDHTFQSTGFHPMSNGFRIDYTDQTTSAGCINAAPGEATFIRQ